MIGDPDLGQEERSQVCSVCEGSGLSKEDDVTRFSGDGGEGLSEWDRNRRQDERDREEHDWFQKEQDRL